MFVDTYSWTSLLVAFYIGASIGFCSGLALFACWLANGHDTDEAEAATRAIEQWRAKYPGIAGEWEKRGQENRVQLVAQPEKEKCVKCGLPTNVDDYGTCNQCHEMMERVA